MPSATTTALFVNLILLSLLLLIVRVRAQDDDGSDTESDDPFGAEPEVTQFVNVTDRYKNLKGRLFIVDTTSPVARELRTASETIDVEMIQPAFKYIDAVWAVAAERRQSNDSRACNMYDLFFRDWPTLMKQRAEIFNVGEIDRTCYSQVDLNDAVNSGELNRSVLQGARSVFENAQRGFEQIFNTLRIRPDGNWSDDGMPYGMINRQKRRADQTCSITSIFAHRKHKIWYLRGAVTNQPVEAQLPPFQRHYLQEYVPRNGTQSLVVPFYNIKDETRLESGTTIVAKWSGTGYSIEDDVFDDPSSPLYKSYKRNVDAVDLAADAITVSNIAILSLPMVMNMIPLSFIADIHSLGMIAYVVVTDVFTTVPFIMKGFELIQSSRAKRQDVFAYFSGNETLGTMQSWVVECTGQEKFRNIGVTFVVLGFFAIIVGIGLELWARQYVMLKRLIAARHMDADIDSDDGSAGRSAASVRSPFGNKFFKIGFGSQRLSSMLNNIGFSPRSSVTSSNAQQYRRSGRSMVGEDVPSLALFGKKNSGASSYGGGAAEGGAWRR